MATVPIKTETLPILSSEDIVLVRQKVRQWAIDLTFSLVDQTKMVTAASELARNALEYGGGGSVRLEQLQNETRRGLRLMFEDSGPGIVDVELALRDGYTTGNGMGLGLGGSRRLVHEFDVDSRPGEGTRVTIVRWK
jgi:serine/threonine-protein kinase RsbT